MYHYVESGLDDVFLVNGYQHHKTPYGKGVSIQNTEGLHKAIGRGLVSLPRPLNGAELRFLRLEMETTQRDLAALVGTSEQTLRLWEKHQNKPLPGSADRLVRAIYSEYIGGDGTIRRMLDRLAELDQVKVSRMSFQQPSKGWKLQDDASLGIVCELISPGGIPAARRVAAPPLAPASRWPAAMTILLLAAAPEPPPAAQPCPPVRPPGRGATRAPVATGVATGARHPELGGAYVPL